jgi:hypothetical protein
MFIFIYMKSADDLEVFAVEQEEQRPVHSPA